MKKQLILAGCLLLGLTGCSTTSKKINQERVTYALSSVNQEASLYIEQETSVYKMIVAASQDGISNDEKTYITKEINELTGKSNVAINEMKKISTHKGLNEQASNDVQKVADAFSKAFKNDYQTMMIEFDYMSGNTEKELEANDARNQRNEQIKKAVTLLNQTVKNYTSD